MINLDEFIDRDRITSCKLRFSAFDESYEVKLTKGSYSECIKEIRDNNLVGQAIARRTKFYPNMTKAYGIYFDKKDPRMFDSLINYIFKSRNRSMEIVIKYRPYKWLPDMPEVNLSEFGDTTIEKFNSFMEYYRTRTSESVIVLNEDLTVKYISTTPAVRNYKSYRSFIWHPSFVETYEYLQSNGQTDGIYKSFLINIGDRRFFGIPHLYGALPLKQDCPFDMDDIGFFYSLTRLQNQDTYYFYTDFLNYFNLSDTFDIEHVIFPATVKPLSLLSFFEGVYNKIYWSDEDTDNIDHIIRDNKVVYTDDLIAIKDKYHCTREWYEAEYNK